MNGALYMFPSLSENYIAKSPSVHSVFSGELSLCNSTGRKLISNTYYKRFFKFVLATAFTRQRAKLPALFNGVLSIVLMCPKKKVCGVDAIAYITFMANQRSFWNFTKRKLPGKSVNQLELSLVCKKAIAALKGAGSPKPASSGLFNFIPKSLHTWNIASVTP